MDSSWTHGEKKEALRLAEMGIPPVTSVLALSTMFGLNPGVVWSLMNRPHRHYRTFNIPKGDGVRQISAPRVLLKIIQKWIAFHLAKLYVHPSHVYGFIQSRSHVEAAAIHCGANWVFSADIADFFPSTSERTVNNAFRSLGYGPQSSELLSKLSCLNGGLAQGAPSSPVLSNLCMKVVDGQLDSLAERHAIRLTRFADDIVFSGYGVPPDDLEKAVRDIVTENGWAIAEKKVSLDRSPSRLKVHGLLVHGDSVRLTKDYRNRIRAYRHLLENNKIREDDLQRVLGHLEYSNFIEKFGSRSG